MAACANCDDHVAKCFSEDIRNAIKNPPHDLSRFFRRVAPANPFQRGDIVRWEQRHHTAIATGNGHMVSQDGGDAAYWAAMARHLDSSSPTGVSDPAPWPKPDRDAVDRGSYDN